jgi:hypothetical protein
LESRKNLEEDHSYQSQWPELREELIYCLNSPNGQIKSKEIIRQLHESQRKERAIIEQKMLKKHGKEILSYFAEGTDINPSCINPQLVLVNKSDSIEGNLFRAATLFWSVPVSRGYGRRMRYLVIDKQNKKLIGIFALGDPVFNLKCRDEWIGWDVHQRRKRLAFVLDAYVLGAIPPYSLMLGAKMIGALLASEEIRKDFRSRYGNRAGLISGCAKDPYLVLITTTSSLGRSSIYNRLKLPGIVNFNRIGTTQGWGHFLVTDDVFKQVRSVLKDAGDPYFNNYKFGQGPNWRLRALRKACQLLGIDDNLLQHGIKREAYGIPLASNWREILKGEQQVPEEACYKAEEIADLALNRWVIPRTQRNNEWCHWSREESWQTLIKYLPMLNE